MQALRLRLNLLPVHLLASPLLIVSHHKPLPSTTTIYLFLKRLCRPVLVIMAPTSVPSLMSPFPTKSSYKPILTRRKLAQEVLHPIQSPQLQKPPLHSSSIPRLPSRTLPRLLQRRADVLDPARPRDAILQGKTSRLLGCWCWVKAFRPTSVWVIGVCGASVLSIYVSDVRFWLHVCYEYKPVLFVFLFSSYISLLRYCNLFIVSGSWNTRLALTCVDIIVFKIGAHIF